MLLDYLRRPARTPRRRRAAPSDGELGGRGGGEGTRLDRWLADRCDVPRNRVRQWIREGLVLVGGRPGKPGQALRAGERVECEPPAPPAEDPRVGPEEGPLKLLWEDADLVVVDKPAGIAVHPGAGRAGGTLANRLVARFPEIVGVGGEGRPGIVHRLDLDTTGALAVARTDAAYRALSKAFARRQVEKTYLAVVYGRPDPASGTIEAPVGRHARKRKEMTVRADGRPATTRYRTLACAEGLSLLELDLLTGRTHQIRVHMKDAGYPLVGDPVYGEARWKAFPKPRQAPLRSFPRPALHARRLAFDHPVRGDERVEAISPIPEDLVRLWSDVTGHPLPAGDQSSESSSV
ncbi:MAG: RluA family pseudouridine synthase [Thermoanaerobaculia bacterium]